VLTKAASRTQVLNAKPARGAESRVVAQAGRKGCGHVATNMARPRTNDILAWRQTRANDERSISEKQGLCPLRPDPAVIGADSADGNGASAHGSDGDLPETKQNLPGTGDQVGTDVYEQLPGSATKPIQDDVVSR